MNKKLINLLEVIIANSGNCHFAKPKDCEICPLARTKSGERTGCIENVGIVGLSTQEANEKYLQAAINTLADIHVEDILKDDDVVNT